MGWKNFSRRTMMQLNKIINRLIELHNLYGNLNCKIAAFDDEDFEITEIYHDNIEDDFVIFEWDIGAIGKQARKCQKMRELLEESLSFNQEKLYEYIRGSGEVKMTDKWLLHRNNIKQFLEETQNDRN